MQTEKIIQIGILLLSFHAVILYFLYKQLRYISRLVDDLEEDLREISTPVYERSKPFSVRFNTFREVPSDLTFVDPNEALIYFQTLTYSQKDDDLKSAAESTKIVSLLIDHQSKRIYSTLTHSAVNRFISFHFDGKIDDYNFVESIERNFNFPTSDSNIDIVLLDWKP